MESTENNLQEELKEAYDEAIGKINASTSFKDDAAKEFLEFVKKQIPKFFTDDYKGNKIREVYNKLRENPKFGCTIKVRDISFAEKEYNEYLHGMDNFIDALSRTNKPLDEIYTMLDGVIQRSRDFTNELFSDSSNPAVDETISSAMEDIEFLIEFMKNIDVLYDYANQAKPKISKVHPKLREKVFTLYCECIVNYVYLIINEVYTTFNKISQVVDESKNCKSNEYLGFKMF